ncbi:PREDICTED: uncharacterized protein LOC109341310 [Lupinus angustifolius]|uniref:uncharacterized protein LOC109341310 n=1 Tax=Lupinus angustifolius TaxID=3871 RepID=UPI00092EF293|nr:PREDICTED: uncharacterized protein LOC109341310 [Lupinus angustifolius]
MPFGLTNAPSTFQALMNEVFKPYLRKFVLVFFYDILVYSNDTGSHCEHLRLVFHTLRQYVLWVNLKKCCFGAKQLEYLGHLILGNGIQANPDKISAMTQWSSSTNIHGLRGFLGLTSYYRRFVKNYGILARPLTQLLKKNKFQWSTEAQTAFEDLKNKMISLPTLALPDFSIPFEIETDASGYGIG